MALRPTSGLMPQYAKTASGASSAAYWLKFYAPGTSNDKLMYTDDSGLVSLAKCKMNTRGEPISNVMDDSSTFIPYVDGDYEAYLFFSEDDADLDNTARSLYLGKNIDPVPDSVSDLTDYQFDTISALKGAATSIKSAFVLDVYDGGYFVFNSSDLSRLVDIDPREGVYVPPSASPSGSAGAWVRQYSGAVFAQWFGARPLLDCANEIQYALEFCKAHGDQLLEVFTDKKIKPYINGDFQVEADNLIFDVGPIYCGRNFRAIGAGQSGELDVTATLGADAPDGSTEITLSDIADVANYPVGSRFVIRGYRNPDTGKPARGYKQDYFVIAHNGAALVLNEPIETNTADGFLIDYNNTEYEANFGEPNVSRLYLMQSILLTADAAPGDISVSVDTSNTTVLNALEVGDTVVVLDTVNPQDFSAYYRSANAYLHEEVNRIAGIDRTAGVITFERPLSTGMEIASYASVTKMNSLKNASIRNMTCTWVGENLVYSNGIEIVNGENCSINECTASGSNGYSWHRHAMRLSSCIDSSIKNFRIDTANYSGGGEGYGAVSYGSSRCSITNGKINKSRHAVLLNRSSDHIHVKDVVSTDCYVADFDSHGGNTNNNIYEDCEAYFGESPGGAQEFGISNIVDNLDGTATVTLSSLVFTEVSSLLQSCRINGSASDIPIYGVISSSNVVTLYFGRDHKFEVGDTINVTGQPTAAYNITGATVSAASATALSYTATALSQPEREWQYSRFAKAVNPNKDIDGIYPITATTTSPLTATITIASIPSGLTFSDMWFSTLIGYDKAGYRAGNPTHFYGDRNTKYIRCKAVGYESDSTDDLVENTHYACNVDAGCYGIEFIDFESINCQHAIGNRQNTKAFEITKAATFVSFGSGQAVFNIDNSDNSIRVDQGISFNGTGSFTATDFYRVVAETATQVTIETDVDPTSASITQTAATQPYRYMPIQNVKFDGKIIRTYPELDSEPCVDLGINQEAIVSDVFFGAHFSNVNNYPEFTNIAGVSIKGMSFEFNAVSVNEVPNLTAEYYPKSLAGSWSLNTLNYSLQIQSCSGVIITQNDFAKAPRGIAIQDSPASLIVANRFAGIEDGKVLRDLGGNNVSFFQDNFLYGASAEYVDEGTTPSFSLQTIP